MIKKLYRNKCTHCLKQIEDDFTCDHLLPESWYGKEIQPIQKWEFPSCFKCNNNLGKIEERLLTAFGMSLNIENPFNEPIIYRVLRSMKSKYDMTEKEKKIRNGKRQKFLMQSIVPINERVKKALLPNFDQSHQPNEDGCSGVLVSSEDLHAFGVKVIKGIEWIEGKRYIKTEDIKVEILSNEAGFHFFELIDKFGEYFHCGESIKIGRAICEDNKDCRLFYIEIWKKLKIYGVVGLSSVKKEKGAVHKNEQSD